MAPIQKYRKWQLFKNIENCHYSRIQKMAIDQKYRKGPLFKDIENGNYSKIQKKQLFKNI